MADFFELQTGEYVVERIKPLPALFFWDALVGTAFFGVLGLMVLFGWGVVAHGSALQIAAVVAFFLALIALGWFLSKKAYERTEYVLTNKRVICRFRDLGLIFRILNFLGYGGFLPGVHTVLLERISSVVVRPNLLPSRVNAGRRIIIRTSDFRSAWRIGDNEIWLLQVSEPERVKKKILELMKDARESQPPN